MTTIIPFIPRSTAVCLPPLQQAAANPEICPLPLLQHRISAAYSFSPADEYAEIALDLNTYLVRNKTAIFFFRVIGDSMTVPTSMMAIFWLLTARSSPGMPYRAGRPQ